MTSKDNWPERFRAKLKQHYGVIRAWQTWKVVIRLKGSRYRAAVLGPCIGMPNATLAIFEELPAAGLWIKIYETPEPAPILRKYDDDVQFQVEVKRVKSDLFPRCITPEPTPEPSNDLELLKKSYVK